MAALLVPAATALAAESASVAGGVLTYTSGDGTVDRITLGAGSGAGKYLITDWETPSGTLGAGCVAAAIGTAECSGVTSAALSTLDGDDSVRVYPALPTTIDGGDGADTLTGGGAADTILGGDGADTIDARDGVVDSVDCGPGADTVQADAIDVLTNCDLPPAEPVEPVVDPVEPSGDPVPPVDPPADLPAVPLPQPPVDLPVDLAPPALNVPAVTITVPEVLTIGANGIATFAVACAPTETGGCDGVAYLDPAPRGRRGKPRALAARRGRYGRSRFSVAAGRTGTVRLPLSASARRAIGLPNGRRARMARRGRRVKAVVTVAPRGRKPVKSDVTIKKH
jgi:hypothetical protein